MRTDSEINAVYDELNGRYNRISTAIIKAILNGSLKVPRKKVHFTTDNPAPPSLAEAEAAFKKYNCVIFTAFRGGYTLKQNLARNARLKADMVEQGMQFRPVTGCYREADWEEPNVEYCYFVWNKIADETREFFRKAYRLSEKYDQDSFLYKRAGINRVAFLVASTDAGRGDLMGDISFAGQLFLGVPDVEAWTDCRDGRFAFQRKGMILIGTRNRKIKCGYGDLFDTGSYGATGLVVLRNADDEDLGHACKSHDGEKVPLAQHTFKKDPSPERLHDIIYRLLKQMRDQRCKKIGFLCNVTVDGSTAEGALYAYDAIRSWAHRYNRHLDQIVIVDTYGDYAKALDQNQ